MKCKVCEKTFDRLLQGEYEDAGIAEYCDSCIKKIEKRTSYQFFKKLYTTIKEDPDEVVELVFKELDGRNAYGSQKNADAARQSLEFLKAQTEG